MEASNIQNEICQRIKDEILSKFENLSEFAGTTSFPYTTVYGYINGNRRPSDKFYILLIKQGFDIQYIFTGCRRNPLIRSLMDDVKMLNDGLEALNENFGDEIKQLLKKNK